MALFWLLAGVLSTLAALILLLPWLRTIPHLGALPRVSWPMAAIAALVLAGVLGLYQWLGRPELAGPAGPGYSIKTPNVANAWTAIGNASSMQRAIASLQARLAKGGGTADDWELLAKSYEFLGRPDDAVRARNKQLSASPASAATAANAKAATQGTAVAAPPSASKLTVQSVKLLADANAARRDQKPAAAVAIYAQLVAANQMDADGWADYADSMASLHGSKLTGEPETFIAHALALDPHHPKALWLKASAAEQASRWSEAVSVWQILESILDPGSADAKIVAANLRQDLKRAPVSPAANFGASGVSGEVTLAESLNAQLPHNATLFIVAKSVDAPGIPVAVLRSTAGTWPMIFTLNDSQAMVPGRTLSSSSRVTIEARISPSGQAMPATGDLQGTSGIIEAAAHQPLRIQIDRVIQ